MRSKIFHDHGVLPKCSKRTTQILGTLAAIRWQCHQAEADMLLLSSCTMAGRIVHISSQLPTSRCFPYLAAASNLTDGMLASRRSSSGDVVSRSFLGHKIVRFWVSSFETGRSARFDWLGRETVHLRHLIRVFIDMAVKWCTKQDFRQIDCIVACNPCCI